MNRRNLLKVAMVAPLAAIADGLDADVGEANPKTKGKVKGTDRYLNIVLSGPFAVNLNPIDAANPNGSVEAWTPALEPLHKYFVNGLELAAGETFSALTGTVLNTVKPALDPIFTAAEVRDTSTPGQCGLKVVLPWPTQIRVGCSRTIQAKKKGNQKPEPITMPLDFVLVYKLTQPNFDQPGTIGLTSAHHGVHPVAGTDDDYLNIIFEVGTQQPDDIHALKVFKRLVKEGKKDMNAGDPLEDISLGAVNLPCARIPGVRSKKLQKTGSGASTKATYVDCTAPGEPGCNMPPPCS